MNKLAITALAAGAVAGAAVADDLPIVKVDRDNVEIRESARIVIVRDVIVDEDGNGVIHILGDDLVVEFSDVHLRGAGDGAHPDEYAGVGVRITGSNVTIRGGRFSGFKVAMHAVIADGLTIEDVDVTDNFRQRLRSTPEQEAVEDWLRPHENDNQEWITKYGAGIAVERSSNITIRRARARNVQNGIILDRVNDSRIYDNDCSFLSGWGLALWRSSGNTISRNAFDFCVRGYSHGVYNRGQDSAGILMFEQCSNNVIAENSATHGGDGFFGFAGREALGEVHPRDDLDWYEGRGNNENVLIGNDFSYAAAHGIEMTFSFDNVFFRNRLAGNAICGIWGGFSQNTLIALNEIEENGDMPYGDEHGGVNIEHGYANRIQENWFRRNPVGVRLWSREDHPMLELPWARANHKGALDNVIAYNDMIQDVTTVEVRNAEGTQLGRNAYFYVVDFVQGDDESLEAMRRAPRGSRIDRQQWDDLELLGESHPVGARPGLRGRERIVLTEWGPKDWSLVPILFVEAGPREHVYYAQQPITDWTLEGEGAIAEYDKEAKALTVRPDRTGRIATYAIVIPTSEGDYTHEGTLLAADWSVHFFIAHADPREDVEVWRQRSTEGAGGIIEHLDFPFGDTGPSQIPNGPRQVLEFGFPVDNFGTLAETQLLIPTGTWRVRTSSADGIRVWLDDEEVIDGWMQDTGAQPIVHTHEFAISEERMVKFRIEHFALEGVAELRFDIERAD